MYSFVSRSLARGSNMAVLQSDINISSSMHDSEVFLQIKHFIFVYPSLISQSLASRLENSMTTHTQHLYPVIVLL